MEHQDPALVPLHPLGETLSETISTHTEMSDEVIGHHQAGIIASGHSPRD